MKVRLLFAAVVILLVRIELCRSADNDSAPRTNLTVRLPAEATVEGDRVTLGQIADITGDEQLVVKAREIGLGQFSAPGQKVTIDRSIILSRLACSGMSESRALLSGADKVTVSRAVKVISSSEFVESSTAFLANSIRDESIARWELIRKPAEVAVPNQPQSIELSPRLVSRVVNGQVIIEVTVIADGQVIGTRQVGFRPKYNTRRVVSVRDVEAGETLTANNTKIEKVVSDDAQPADWSAPYGFIAVRNLPAGTIIGSGMVRRSQPQMIIERNQTVVIRIERPGLVVTGIGKAMEEGKLGQCIKVRNIDSQRVILAKVNEDGSVEPVL